MEGMKDKDRDEGTSDHHTHVVQHKTTSSIPSADSGKGSNVTTVTKRRKMIQMNDAQCLSHSMTSEGAMPLTNPKPQGLSKSRNWDANRGLYPRQSTSRTRSHWSPKKGGTVCGQGHSALLGSPKKQGRMDTYFPISPKKSSNSDVAYHNDHSKTDPNHTHSQSYNRQNGQGHSALLGLPKRQEKMDTYFPISPKKSPKKSLNSEVANHRDYLQTDANHTYFQSCNRQNESSTSSLRSPRKYTQATFGTPPAHGNDQTCPQGIYFQKPQGSIKRTPKKSSSNQMQCMETSTVSNAGSLGMGLAGTLTEDDKPRSIAAHAPVKALFPTKGPSRYSTDLVRDFEEDVLITTEMFDHATGNIEQDKQTSRHKPGCSSSLDKEFEDDDFFTAEDFDEVLQSSQGHVQTKENHRKTTDFERALEEEDLTAEEFDDILQSSQSPVKNGAFKYSPKKTTYGLLGDDDQSFSDDVEDDVDYFSRLPDEILENILGQLPILDMCLTASSVCKRWHSIISRERVSHELCIP